MQLGNYGGDRTVITKTIDALNSLSTFINKIVDQIENLPTEIANLTSSAYLGKYLKLK
jgi:hypothetical protein